MNLILLQPEDFFDEGLAVLSDDRAHHIRKVLKAEPGQVLRIGLLDGPLGSGTVLSCDHHTVSLHCSFESELPPRPQIDLLLAMPRPKVMRRLWAQLAAMGIGRIVLVNAAKVERFYFDSHVLDPIHYRERLREGLQQARCTYLPEVFIRPRFKPFVEDELEHLFREHHKLLADPSGEKRISNCVFDARRVVLAIGPEGGWTAFEIDLLQQVGFETVAMGSRILRTDTACIGLLAVLSEQRSN